MSAWFQTFVNEAKKVGDSIAQVIDETAKAAEGDFLAEQQKMKEQKEYQTKPSSSTLLPWETTDEALAILSDELMDKIMKLSLVDNNFTVTPESLASKIEFSFKDYVPVIMKLLPLDSNLSKIHAKLSPKMNEEVFWKNYYYRVMYLRAKIGIDGPEAQDRFCRCSPC